MHMLNAPLPIFPPPLHPSHDSVNFVAREMKCCPLKAYMVWHLGDVLGCVLLLVLIKFIVVATVMKSFGFSWEASTLAGACMAQVNG